MLQTHIRLLLICTITGCFYCNHLIIITLSSDHHTSSADDQKKHSSMHFEHMYQFNVKHGFEIFSNLLKGEPGPILPNTGSAPLNKMAFTQHLILRSSLILIEKIYSAPFTLYQSCSNDSLCKTKVPPGL